MTNVTMDSMTLLVERVPNGTVLPPPDVPTSHDDLAATFAIGTILSLMCLVGVSGNIYTLVVMCHSMRTSASMYIYIINLAMADLLYLLTIPFVVCTHFLTEWYFGDVGCRMLISSDFLTMHASIFTLTIMSTERYFAVLKPLDTVKRSKSYRKAIALLVWVASIVLAMPMMVGIQLKVGAKSMCQTTLAPIAYKSYISFLFCTSILLGQFYPALPISNKAKRNINYLTTCLTYSNSCINPFLYTLLTKNYKEYLRKRQRTWTASSYFSRRSRFQRSPRRSPSSSSQQCTESFVLTHTASLRTHNSSL
ncbi:hypothetical protein CRUP_000240 [Coryphaenoides rupestris]|nr:hypothetical protein CRUP_000240 [Coryphaenoides rupestris]